jgi:hypothetical protein
MRPTTTECHGIGDKLSSREEGKKKPDAHEGRAPS